MRIELREACVRWACFFFVLRYRKQWMVCARFFLLSGKGSLIGHRTVVEMFNSYIECATATQEIRPHQGMHNHQPVLWLHSDLLMQIEVYLVTSPSPRSALHLHFMHSNWLHFIVMTVLFWPAQHSKHSELCIWIASHIRESTITVCHMHASVAFPKNWSIILQCFLIQISMVNVDYSRIMVSFRIVIAWLA